MTVPELLGILLAIVGLAFAFETPRKWFLRKLRLHRVESTLDNDQAQQLTPRANASHHHAKEPEAPPTPATSYVSVQEIVDAINNAPPFQQETVAEHYVGIPVEWEGFLRNVKQDPRDISLVQVNLITDRSRIVGHSIWFSTHPDKLPEIKTLQRDSKLRVVGKIQSASGPGLCVTIDADSILVLERAA